MDGSYWYGFGMHRRKMSLFDWEKYGVDIFKECLGCDWPVENRMKPGERLLLRAVNPEATYRNGEPSNYWQLVLYEDMCMQFSV